MEFPQNWPGAAVPHTRRNSCRKMLEHHKGLLCGASPQRWLSARSGASTRFSKRSNAAAALFLGRGPGTPFGRVGFRLHFRVAPLYGLIQRLGHASLSVNLSPGNVAPTAQP
jgi:hypothetical protein